MENIAELTLEKALSRIRPHTKSLLPNQKTPATLLAALESTLDDQKADRSAVAYFAALLTTIEATIQKKDVRVNDGDVLPAELYLLALVMPFVPASVLRTQLTTFLSLTSPLFPLLEAHAPAIKSQLTIYDHLLTSLDRSQLDTQEIRQSFASILQLCLDKRPKVRRKAAEVVDHVLSNPPPPLARHPYSERVAVWVQSVFSQINANMLGKFNSSVEPADLAIHLLAFLRAALLHLPSSTFPEIALGILGLPRFGTPYVTQAAYSTLSTIFLAAAADHSSPISAQVHDVLKAVLSSPPLQSDTILSPPWIEVVGNAMLAYHAIDEQGCEAELWKVWKIVWAYLESTNSATRKSARKTLEQLTECFTASSIEFAAKDSSSPVSKIVFQSLKALDSLPYARAIPEVLSVAASLIQRLGADGQSLIQPMIEKIGSMRTQKNFEYKEDADKVLGTAMRVLGPKVLLSILPLNLEPSDRQENREPRAYLLPLLSQTHPCPVEFFVSYFVPLSERMFDLQQKADIEGRPSEAKVWSVLVAQIWAGLPYYNWTTADLPETLNQQFSQLLSQVLYGQPELRSPVLRALKVMVESNLAGAKSTEEGADVVRLNPQQAQNNVDFLATQAESWLAVLFNVYGSVGADLRQSVGEVIDVWASISGGKDMTQAFHKVLGLFKQNLVKSRPTLGPNGPNEGSVTSMMQDILLILLPYISMVDTQTLFNTILSSQVLCDKENVIQKRGYKLLVKTVEANRIPLDPETVLKQLDEFAESLSPAAKKARFNLLSLLVQRLSSSAMHIVPSLIPEAVLGTKEPSEKGRLAAFDFIIVMGKKMSEGGVVKRSMMDGMDEDDSKKQTDAVASINEYITMVAGGLAGATPHMISATVTAISRLIFEFKDHISDHMQSEILNTLLVFLTSNNREIVKSVLGYVKLVVHTLSIDILRPCLPQLVHGLLGWCHDHKNHFKEKSRHVFERIMRRFSWEEVYACVSESEQSQEGVKVLLNIKKRKDRLKRKKAARKEVDDSDDEKPITKRSGGDAFEDIVYGSESELEDSDDDEEIPAAACRGKPAPPQRKKKDTGGARLRLDDDEPMDLLEGAAMHISSSKFGRERKPGRDAARFKTDEGTGKMIFDDSSDDEHARPKGASSSANTVDVSGTAYHESITGVDGFTRGPNGKVKFNKDTKKRRRQETETADMDVDMGDIQQDIKSKVPPSKKTKQNKFGHEFKAKKAGGDVKKGGTDPYAYMSLTQAAKKNPGGKAQLGIAGKH